MAKILMVDDDADVLEVLSSIVRNAGHEVAAEASGRRALEILDGPAPVELLVTDVAMPDSNGFNLARLARMRRPTLRILFVTGYAERAEALRDRLDDYGPLMMKPMLPGALRDEISSVLSEPV